MALDRADAIDEELGFKNEEIEQHHLDVPVIDTSQRVQHFINTQPHGSSIGDLHEDFSPAPLHPHNQEVQPPSHSLNPAAPTFTPSPDRATPVPNSDRTVMESYIQFMAQREIANKIEKFDDRPENYHSWKAGFKNMTTNVNITPSEELTLMIEYTNSESKKIVQRLRNAYITNPAEGVGEAWGKIGERFGSNVVITEVHLNKLKTFTKIGHKDDKSLHDLGDLLLELQCAKRDGELKGLKILDKPSYLKLILTKLSMTSKVDGRGTPIATKFSAT